MLGLKIAMPDVTQAILDSLLQAPLLIGDLPNAMCFDRALLEKTRAAKALNLNQKLGHIYEDALVMTLKSSAHVNFLDQSVQLFDEDKQTIGELDFILADKRLDKHIHLELGVKFYLAYKTSGGWIFPGPNARDNWPRKLTRLQNHQLCITERPETRNMLRSRYSISQIEPQQLVYGCLCVPVNHCGSEQPRLEFMAPNARTGHWLYADQWATCLSGYNEIYVIPKALWPVVPCVEYLPLFDRYAAHDFLKAFRTQGAMFVTEDCTETYFLAPDFWPQNS